MYESVCTFAQVMTPEAMAKVRTAIDKNLEIVKKATGLS